jgi:hypothetical protein
MIAPFLTELQARVKNEGIRIGSYPQLTRGVVVSLIGPDEKRVREVGEEVRKRSDLFSIEPHKVQVVQELQGAVVEAPEAGQADKSKH